MMKQTHKYSKTQFQALFEMYQLNVSQKEFTDPTRKLLHAIQMQIWIKIQKQSIEIKKNYKISLTPVEEMGFMIYWGFIDIPVTSLYGHVIQTTINTIHPKYV